MNVFNKITKSSLPCLLIASALVLANRSSAQNRAAPTSGLEILDLANLNGGANPITTDNIAYSAEFTATTAASTVTFVFRQDPGFFTLSNTSIVDTTAGSTTNLLANPDFTEGAPTTAGAGVPEWTYFIQTGNLFPQFLGYELTGGGFFDGSTQAYDGIDQTFATVAGDTYTVSFDLANDTSGGVFQQTSTNGDITDTGGNGIDAVVYAGNGLPPTSNVPDGASTFVMILGSFAILAYWKRRSLGLAQS